MPKKSVSNIIIHIAVWLVLVAVPLLVQLEFSKISARFMGRVWFMLGALAIVFYANYSFAIKRLLYNKRHLLFAVFNAGLFVALYFLQLLTNTLIDDLTGHVRHKSPSVLMQSMFIYNDILYFVLGIGAALGVRYTSRVNQLEREKLELDNERTQSEITMLKYQLQPHFFFNTLNNIYSLIAIDGDRAQKAVMNLSKMMRYVLYDNKAQKIPLSSEVEFIDNYCRLKRLSLPPSVKVDIELPDPGTNFSLPPLILITLIENAFKHGVAAAGESRIDIRLTAGDNSLRLLVRNTMGPPEPGDSRTNSGIGLTNMKRLLDLQYPNGGYTLRHGPDGKGDYEAELTIMSKV